MLGLRLGLALVAIGCGDVRDDEGPIGPGNDTLRRK